MNPVFFRPMGKGRPALTSPSERAVWARRIGEARARAKISQERLAELLGKSQSTVGGYETGKSEPDLATIERLASIFSVSPAWLAFGIGDPDESDPLAFSVLERYKHDKLFAFAFSNAARLFAEEGFQADLAYLGSYTLKLLRLATGSQGDEAAQEHIRRSLDADRAEIRAEYDEMRKKRL
jgi:transcriptional regulator with XRE-family HTH domain